jgi:hypothetical protein
LARSTIAVVGLGGLGSLVALELAHLGAGSLVLIDPDVVERSNLNRLIGASARDVGRPKVDVYASMISKVSPTCQLMPVRAPIIADEALRATKQSDLLLSCVDSHGARLVINQLAVQYRLPLVDGGTGVRLGDQQHRPNIGGQVQVVLPGLGCLSCRGFIDARQAALDLAPASVRQRELDHGYGTNEPAPAVVFLNGVVASIQVTETMRLICGIAGEGLLRDAAPITTYDLLRQSIVQAQVAPDPACTTCGIDGVGGLADLSPLYHADMIPPTRSGTTPGVGR